MRFRHTLVVVVGLVTALSACESEGAEMLVEVKTDLVPGIEFTAVEVRLAQAQGAAVSGSPPLSVIDTVRTRTSAGTAAEAAFFAGSPVGSFRDVAPGSYWVLTSLVDDSGRIALQRPTIVDIGDADFGLTVLLTRDCSGVECPAVGGGPELLACLAGECVDTRCHPRAAEFCPAPECSADGDCTGGVDCAPPRCTEEGICLLGPRSDMCAAGEYCGPDLGCLPSPVAVPDAGVVDGGVTCGTICFPPARPCFAGYYACDTDAGPVCSDLIQVVEGTSCGPGMMCDAVGACVPTMMMMTCTPGGLCWTGCTEGVVDCAGGVRSCTIGATNAPVGTPCDAGLTCYDGEACAGLLSCNAAGACVTPGPTRVSVGTGGVEADRPCRRPSLSADGAFVLFESQATNLVADDTNAMNDIFIHDIAGARTERVSVSTAGVEGDRPVGRAAASGGGRFVIFESISALMVMGDTNSVNDVFLRDVMMGITERISVDSAGGEATGDSRVGDISADGRFVVFDSSATNLVSGDTNAARDCFLRDRMTNTTTRVSLATGGVQTTHSGFFFGSGACRVSDDGDVVAFISDGNNLAGLFGEAEIYVYVRSTMTAERITVTTGGGATNGTNNVVGMSGDGRYVWFGTLASNIVVDDLNGQSDVFVRDRMMGTTTHLSVSSTGEKSNRENPTVDGSADGMRFVFDSGGSNLVVDDTNSVADVFLRDLATGMTTRISLGEGGTQTSGGNSTAPRISADGRRACFESGAGNLVGDDLNGVVDVFCTALP